MEDKSIQYVDVLIALICLLASMNTPCFAEVQPRYAQDVFKDSARIKPLKAAKTVSQPIRSQRVQFHKVQHNGTNRLIVAVSFNKEIDSSTVQQNSEYQSIYHQNTFVRSSRSITIAKRYRFSSPFMAHN
jgi:hypothetical protein